jgi:hypothetical protein
MQLNNHEDMVCKSQIAMPNVVFELVLAFGGMYFVMFLSLLPPSTITKQITSCGLF